MKECKFVKWLSLQCNHEIVTVAHCVELVFQFSLSPAEGQRESRSLFLKRTLMCVRVCVCRWWVDVHVSVYVCVLFEIFVYYFPE